MATLKWKIEFLKGRMARPDSSLLFAHGCDETEMGWIKQMQIDDLIRGDWRSSQDGQVFTNIHVTEKGEKLTEPPKTDWVRVGVWITLGALAVTAIVEIFRKG
jgi:hypothetical protein